MWFFVDESWSPDNVSPPFGVLFGVLVKEQNLQTFDNLFFAARKKYFGAVNAKCLESELKGKDVFSNYVLKLMQKSGSLPNNICVFKEIVSYPQVHPAVYFKLFSSVVFSEDGRHPSLLSPDYKHLARPFSDLIQNVSRAAIEEKEKNVTLIFDQRMGVQTNLAISIRNFIGGLNFKNVHPFPYFAVSNVCPMIQMADWFAYLMSKRVQRVRAIYPFFEELKKLQWISNETQAKYGFNYYNEKCSGHQRVYEKNPRK